MKIKSIHVWEADLGNTKPYTIAFKTVDQVRNAFVEITLADGTTGIGSGNPSEYVVGENLQQTLQALTPANLEFLIGRNIFERQQLAFAIQKHFPLNPAARAALDIALFDALTKKLDIPLAKYLGQKIFSLPTSNTIGIKSVDETVREGKEFVEQGFSILKVKLGKNLEEDIERLEKLRETLSKDIVIRIDANQGYTVEETLAFAKRTAALNIELIEQPLPAKAIDAMRALPTQLKKILAADESLLSPSDAWSLIQEPIAAGIFNIKLMKCGGVTPALKIADIAAWANIDLFWGCNDESAVSITAALHAAFACENTRYIDLDGSLDLGNDVVRGGFILKDGIMSLTDKPGLGVERIR